MLQGTKATQFFGGPPRMPISDVFVATSTHPGNEVTKSFAM